MKQIIFSGVLAGTALFARAQTLEDARKLTDREQFQNATATFRKLLAASPNDGATWYYFGENYFSNDQIDSAQNCYGQGDRANPRFPLNKAGLGKILMVQGKRAEAQVHFDAAIEAAESKVNKYGKDLRAATYREVAKGLGAGNKPDIAVAMGMLNKALELVPTDAESYLVKGDLLMASGSYDVSEAVAAYKRAAELMPNAARPISKVARLYYRAHSYDAALAEFDRAISNDPGFAPAYSGRAEAYFVTKAYDKATADYEKYLELNKGNSSARVRYAKFLFLTNKYTECLHEIATLQAGGMRDPALKRFEAYALFETKDYENAREKMNELQEMVTRQQLTSTDLEYMGKIYQGLATTQVPEGAPVENYDSLAAEMYLSAARMDRTKEHLFTEAVKIYSKAKMYDKAIAAVQEKMTATGKVDANDWYYLGTAAQKTKRWPLADSAWTKYIERQPNIHQGYLGRARANSSIDSLKTSWQARPFYEDVIRRMKPEDQTKYKVDLEEAYFYLGFYYFNKDEDMGMARCFFEKLKELNAGTSNTKVGTDMLLTKELKDVSPKDCSLQ